LSARDCRINKCQIVAFRSEAVNKLIEVYRGSCPERTSLKATD